MTEPVAVFDLDGTLVDTAPDLLDSLNHCLIHAGLDAAEPISLKRFVGQGGRVMITRAAEAQQKLLNDSEIDRMLEMFLTHYAANMPGKSTPYPGVVEAIDGFSAQGYRIAICTNKFQHLSIRLIEGLGLSDKFAAICGCDRFEFRKPDPRHLTETILAAGGDPAISIMIGDSRTDIDTAIAAGIPVVAVDWGYTDQHVSHFQPTTIISHFRELTPDLAKRLIDAKC